MFLRKLRGPAVDGRWYIYHRHIQPPQRRPTERKKQGFRKVYIPFRTLASIAAHYAAVIRIRRKRRIPSSPATSPTPAEPTATSHYSSALSGALPVASARRARRQYPAPEIAARSDGPTTSGAATAEPLGQRSLESHLRAPEKLGRKTRARHSFCSKPSAAWWQQTATVPDVVMDEVLARLAAI
jgi:hypothetical protein